jgi:autotransporter adhesin
MNKVYKSVWNESIGAWVAVAETANGRGKATKSKKILTAAMLITGAGASLDAIAAGGGTSIGACANTNAGVSSSIAINGTSSEFCTNATGISSVAIGPTATAGGAGSGADINGSGAGDYDQTSFGVRTKATARSATAVGSDAAAAGIASAALGYKAQASGNSSVSMGDSSSASQQAAVAIGAAASASALNAAAVGRSATASGQNAAALGATSKASGTNAVAIGSTANATASDSVALGANSVADRAGTVSVGSSTNKRQIVNVAAGTQSADATNVGQLTPVLTALGGKAAVNADGSITAPAYSLKGTTYNNVGDALTALADSSGKYFHVNSSGVDSSATGTNAVAIGAESVSSGGNTTAIGYKAISSGSTESIAIGSDVQSTANDAISMGSQVVNAAASSIVIGSNGVSLDSASNTSVLLAPDTGDVVNSSHSFSFNPYGGTGTSNSNDSINLSGTVANAAAGVSIGSKSSVTAANAVALGASASASAADALAIGHSAKASVANSIALGANSVADRVDTVSVGSTAGMRQITNVANGTQANDAVNVSQLQNVTTLLGGGAALKPDGTVTAPAYAVAGTTLGTVGAAIAKIDSELGNKVAYDAADKSRVTLGGTTALAPVALSNVKAGALSAASTDAVNGSQLFATNTDVSALKTFTDDIKNGGGIKYFHTNSKLADSSATGADSVAIGGATNASSDNAVALGSNSVADRPNSVSVGAAGKERQITNVAAGMAFTDAVNVQQLNAISDSAVKYDTNPDGTPNYQSVNLGGKGAAKPTSLTNLKVADLSATSTDAVNGSQLFGTNQRVGSLETFEGNINNGGGIKYFHTNSKLADSSAAGADSVAIGGAANASAKNAVALGSNSVADRANTVSVGAAGKERQITNVEAGTQSTDAVNLAQLTAVSKDVTTLGSFAVKYDAKPDGTPNTENVTLGGVGAAKPTKLTNLKIADLSATSTDAVNGSQLFGTNQRVGSLETFATNINNGGGIKYFHTNSKLADSAAAGADSVAIGGAANASADNAVALGSNSVADRVNSVSVGAAGKERQITNVEAGTQSTDAVNVSQLTAVSKDVTTLGSFAVKYDTKTDGTPDYERVTLGDAATKKATLLTNLKNADLSADSTDAVNGSQLYATNQDVAKLQGFTNNINNGGGITFFHTNSKLADSSATGADSVAIGGAAVSSGKNAVALGSNSVADRDNTVSVGAAGSERQVTNVAAGTAATDAANVGQLNAVSNNVTLLGASAIKYDTNADGTPDYANATLGNGNAAGTALHNVAAGTSGMDAVNVAQMNDMIGQVTNIANGAYNPLFTAEGNRDTEVATSSGTHSVASGANAVASGANAIASGATSVASGSNAIAVGSSASATANNAVAVGANASATANNAVALGSGSVADRANSVSVGTTSPGGQRQVTNVAAGTDGTDAVNVNQMQQSVSSGVKSAKGYTDALRSDMNTGLSLANNHINSVGAMSSAMAMMAGSAAAVADKDNRFAAGTGVYRNKAAIAIGFQKRFGTNMVITVGGSTTGEESTGGAGFAFGF